MAPNEAVIRVVEALESAGVAYMLVGAYSVNVYGVPRSTKDADFVVQIDPAQMDRLASRLGQEFRLDPQISFEAVTATQRFIVHVGRSPFRIELFCLGDDQYQRERFTRRRPQQLLGRTVSVPAPEDVIVQKLLWSRQGQRGKDLDDARNVIAVQGNLLDWDYIHDWCDQHGTRDLLEQVRRSIPPDASESA